MLGVDEKEESILPAKNDSLLGVDDKEESILQTKSASLPRNQARKVEDSLDDVDAEYSLMSSSQISEIHSEISTMPLQDVNEGKE